jgi:hypothetical protein
MEYSYIEKIRRAENFRGRFKSRVAGSEGCSLDVKGTPVAGSNECPFFAIVRYCALLFAMEHNKIEIGYC